MKKDWLRIQSNSKQPLKRTSAAEGCTLLPVSLRLLFLRTVHFILAHMYQNLLLRYYGTESSCFFFLSEPSSAVHEVKCLNLPTCKPKRLILSSFRTMTLMQQSIFTRWIYPNQFRNLSKFRQHWADVWKYLPVPRASPSASLRQCVYFFHSPAQ